MRTTTARLLQIAGLVAVLGTGGHAQTTTAGTTRTYVADGRAVPASYEPFFPTVAQLFDEIGRALDEGAHDVRATYDARTGAPLDVFIDWEERTADEEQGWNLTPPEPL